MSAASDKLTINLLDRKQAWGAIKSQVFPFLAVVLQSGRGFVMTIQPGKRSAAQNRRYWGRGVLAQVAEKAIVGGRRYSAEAWHEQFKRQFIGVIETPDGRVMGASSAKLTVKEFCEFCERVEAYASTELGVEFENLEPNE